MITQKFKLGVNYTYKDGRLHPNTKKWVRSLLGYAICNHCSESFIESHNIHIHHIDHNNTNNLLSNLELICAECHNRHHKTGNTYNTGREFPTLRLFSDDEESEICEAYASGKFTQVYLSKSLGCSEGTIRRILKCNR